MVIFPCKATRINAIDTLLFLLETYRQTFLVQTGQLAALAESSLLIYTPVRLQFCRTQAAFLGFLVEYHEF